MKNKSIVYFSVGVVIVGALAFLGSIIADLNYRYHGALYTPFPDTYQFELNDVEGNIFRMADQRGKVVLIFFGYTHCPDFCPTTLTVFKQVFTALGDQADRVEFVFITVDPQRDTAELVGKYVAAFNPEFVGLSGTLSELEPVWHGYFIFPEIESGEDGQPLEENYEVAHGARVYVVDGYGRLRLTFPNGMAVGDIVEDIEHLLKEVD
ncbi:MAG: SCO family protein [Anaerolineae bacterium]|nr:SCO family protein [Anaerolineae bacterium]